MYKVMIVEDEMLVRLGLKNSIDWGKFNMTVIADVSDGMAALETYQQMKADVIITDLKMPVMSGMELIANIRRLDKNIIIIIITCLEEFELVRKAISMGVYEYISKTTMTEEETEVVLAKVQAELDKQKESRVSDPELAIDINLIKEKLIKDFLFCNTLQPEEFEKHINKLYLRLNSKKLVLCILEIDQFDFLQEKFKDDKGQPIKLSVMNILNEVLISSNRGEVFYDNERHYILVFSFSDVYSEQSIQQQFSEILAKITCTMRAYFNASCSFGVSGVYSGYSKLKSMYTDAKKALEQKFIIGQGTFSASDSINNKHIYRQKTDTLRKVSKISELLGEYGMKEYNSKIEEMQNTSTLEKEHIQQLFEQLAHWICRLSVIKSEHFGDELITFSHEIFKCETLDDIIDAYKTFILEITKRSFKVKGLGKEVLQIVEFINNHYDTDINLQQVADHVKFSSSYVSSLFKKKLNIGFVDYINELRVEKARELLLNTYLKSYEIAEKVGFSENTYFCKVFKKYTGLSPGEFRKKNMKEWTEDMEDDFD